MFFGELGRILMVYLIELNTLTLEQACRYLALGAGLCRKQNDALGADGGSCLGSGLFAAAGSLLGLDAVLAVIEILHRLVDIVLKTLAVFLRLAAVPVLHRVRVIAGYAAVYLGLFAALGGS